MAKINREEYEVLKGLHDKWKWIARDGEYNSLNVFSVKPIKTHSQWDYMDVGYKHARLTKEENKMFQFIQWEYEKPHNIAELIKEYEIDTGMRYDFGKIKVVDIDTSKLATRNGYIYVKESEETEVKKDIEWANREIKKVRDLLNNKRYEEEVDDFTTGVLSGLKKALDILDQLDEPEVLSSDWIKKNQRMWASTHGVDYHVPANKLYGKIVPKQEDLFNGKKPAIPKFVADWIEDNKDKYERNILAVGHIFYRRNLDNLDVDEWLQHNIEAFTRAWLDGYTIKKEHKYYAKIKGWENVTTGSEAFNWVYFKEKDTVGISKAVENKYQAVSFTKYDWNNLGINEDNADFLLVEELEE